MFIEYLDKLRMYGKRHFTFQDIIRDLHISENAAKSGLFRLKKANKIITPLKGLYVMIPPECQPYRSIPTEELVPIIMNHLNVDYYVGLISAGLYYGATHQKTARFQVITNKRVKHPLKFGEVEIELVYKDIVGELPTKDFVVSTGYLKVATPELIVIDLFKYSARAGGINHIATVLSELAPSIIDELLATKLQALYQRRKGRDLFDVWYVAYRNLIDINKVFDIFSQYCTYNKVKITGEEFLKNLELKKNHRDFHMDMSVLLPSKLHWDFDEAYQFVLDNVVSRLP